MPTLAELRTISKEHDLSTSGTKEQLMARIHKHQMTGCTRPHHRLSGRKSMTRRSSPRKSAGCGCGKKSARKSVTRRSSGKKIVEPVVGGAITAVKGMGSGVSRTVYGVGNVFSGNWWSSY
jgi:hypothetical protein